MDELKFNDEGEAFYDDNNGLDAPFDWNDCVDDNDPRTKEIESIKKTIKYAMKGSNEYNKALNRAINLGLSFYDSY